MLEARKKVRKLIFAITGVVVAIIIIRLALEFLLANKDHFLAEFVFAISNPLVQIFWGTFTDSGLGLLQVPMELAIAIVFYIFAGILMASLITSLIQDKASRILAELLDTLFKFLEFLLIARLVLKLFGVAPESAFVETVYGLTNWVGTLLPTIDILGGVLELSTLFILVVVVVFDLISEGLFEETKKPPQTGINTSSTTVIKEVPPSPVVTVPPQNITINIPVQQPVPLPQQPRTVVPQVINVHPPVNNTKHEITN